MFCSKLFTNFTQSNGLILILIGFSERKNEYTQHRSYLSYLFTPSAWQFNTIQHNHSLQPCIIYPPDTPLLKET